MDLDRIRNFSIIAHIDHGKSTLADRILELTETVSGREMRAQVLDTMELERERGITIKAQAVRVVNKIDLPQAEPGAAAAELAELVGGSPDDVLRISAKTGEGVADVLDAIVERIPMPSGLVSPDAPPRALVFDSAYDQYRGVVAFVRVVDGTFSAREPLRAMAQGTRFEAEEVGFFSPTMKGAETLAAGEVGYVITGLKDVSRLRVGDTLTSERTPAAEALPGYKDVKPMVFAGLFPTDSDDYPDLRDALERLKLNDAALFYEPETSQALGFGFRCGFLGLLHMEIVRERLEREFDLDLLVSGEPVDALSLIAHREGAYERGRALVERLRDEIPRQLFDVAIQAAIGSRVIARETVKARRKDVLAKCYGGDITRKRKLLEKQKAGKRRE